MVLKFIKKTCNSIFNHVSTNLFYATLTIYALFADDIRILLTPKNCDVVFSTIICIIIIFFLLEFLYSWIFISKYFCCFFFWLDIISLSTLFLDIHWLNDALIGGDYIISTISLRNNFSNLSTAVKMGSKAIRVLRLFKLTKLSRISKLYKIKQKLDENFSEKKLNENINSQNSEMRVARKLSDLILRRVILLILSMIVGIIFFDPTFYLKADSSMEFGMKIFNEFPDYNDPDVNLTFNIYAQEHMVKKISQ